MIPICNATLDAIADERPLSFDERRHAKSCPRCRLATQIPEQISAASRALCAIEPAIGFPTRAISMARSRSRNRRFRMLMSAGVVAAAVSILVIALWPSDSTQHRITTPSPQPAPTRDAEPFRLAQPAAHFEPNWVLAHDEALSLTSAQKEKLRDLAAELGKDVVGITAKIQIEEIDLSRELRRKKPNRKKINQHIARVGKLKAQLRSAHTMAWLDARAALTEDQQLVVATLVGGERDAERPSDSAATSPISADDRVAELERQLKAERQARKDVERKLAERLRHNKLEIYQTLDEPMTTGILQVNSKPYSFIYIDGKKMGVTPARLELKAGRHKVHLMRPDLGQKRAFYVTIEAGKTRRLITQFDTIDD